MGNAPSNAGPQEAEGGVESVTFTNPYQRPQGPHPTHSGGPTDPQQRYGAHHSNAPYHSHHHRNPASPHQSIHPSTIPIASQPVDAMPRPRFPTVREQYRHDSPAGSSPLGSESSYEPSSILTSEGYQRRHQFQHHRTPIPGSTVGVRRRSSSLVSGRSFVQYADTFNGQALLATAAHQDKLEHQRHPPGSLDSRASYRNSARVSRAFEPVDPLKSLDDPNDDLKDGNVPTIITWSQGGTNVYVTGTFNNWKQKVRLNKSNSDFSTILNLLPGTHRIKFIVDDEWKCSTELPAATDAEGNLVNFLEVADEEQDELEGTHETPINGTPPGSYTDQIPLYAQSNTSSPGSSSGSDQILPLTAIQSQGQERGRASTTSSSQESSPSSSRIFDSESPASIEPPPALPPHLEKVILNNMPSKEDNSVLPVPNHVVLNHLYACSVKEGVLSISVTARYRKKYITTVFIKPVVTDS